mgnify:CR=1 FL=1
MSIPVSILNYATLNKMKRRKKPIWLLIGGLLSLVIFIYLIVFFSPNFQFSIFNFQLPILPVFLLTSFFLFFSVSSFLLNNMRRGIFIGLFVSVYLLLRFLDLTHIFFLIMLLILFTTLEMFFSYKK